jgi:uncharacterized protein (TIGR02145 family)
MGVSVTITNMGTGEVTLSRPTPVKYYVMGAGSTPFPAERILIPAGESVKLTILPKTDLTVGRHDETITFTTDEGATASIRATFTVTKPLTWATTNVITAGEFAAETELLVGRFTFADAQNACPDGWRLPTKAEFESRFSTSKYEWASKRIVQNPIQMTVYGLEFVSDKSFFRAAGYRHHTDKEVKQYNENGYYWTSDSYNTDKGYALHFNKDMAEVQLYDKPHGFSVRCVKK